MAGLQTAPCLRQDVSLLLLAQAEAAVKTCNGSLERAADWLFSHSDNLDAAVAAVSAPAAPPGQQPPAVPAPAGDLCYNFTAISCALSCCTPHLQAAPGASPGPALHGEMRGKAQCAVGLSQEENLW